MSTKSLHRNEEFKMSERPSEDKSQYDDSDDKTSTKSMQYNRISKVSEAETQVKSEQKKKECKERGTAAPAKSRNEEPSVLFVSETYKSQNLLSALPHQSKYFRESVPVDVSEPPSLISETITGHKSLRLRLRDLEKSNANNDQIILLFIGTPDKNGRSWHAESNTVERAVNFMLKKLQIGGFFLKIHVGSRLEWMDPDNAFKKDHKIELANIPTLWVWNSQKKISGKRCTDVESLYLMLKD